MNLSAHLMRKINKAATNVTVTAPRTKHMYHLAKSLGGAVNLCVFRKSQTFFQF